MTTSIPKTCSEVFSFYSEAVKPIYSHVEAIQNKLPIELLFEIHSAFDHLKRFYVDGIAENECAHAAYGHLKRGVLDAFKIDLKVFNEEIEMLQQRNDLSLIDSGKYWPNFINKKTEIYQLATEARLNVTNHDLDDAFEKWSKVSIKISEFRKEMICDKIKDFEWASKTSKKIFTKETLIAFLIGCASSVVVSLLIA